MDMGMMMALTEERKVTLSMQAVKVLGAVTMLFVAREWPNTGGRTIDEGRCAAAYRLFQRFESRAQQVNRKEFRMGFDTEERGILTMIFLHTYHKLGILERSVAGQVMMELGIRN